MRPALWVLATCYVSLSTCIISIGAVCVLAHTGRVGAVSPADLDALRASVERMADEIRFSDLGHKHIEVRNFIIQSQLAQVKDPVVFVGDSIIESAFLPGSLCGHPVINAGLGGANARLYFDFGQQVLPALKSALIVVAIGTNDSATIAARYEGPFESNYSRLIQFLKPHAASLVLVGIPPLEMTGPLARDYFDQAASEKNNRTINAIAADNSIPFADVRSTMTSEKLTVDGVHLNPDGYQGWMTAVSAVASKTLNCQAASN